VHIRVIKDDGRTIGTIDSVLRNLMRIVDQLPFFYGVGITSAVLNRKSKRLGDLVAGTIVVHERTLQDIRPVWQAGAQPEGLRLGAERLTVEDLTIIEAFLNRRDALESYVRYETAAKIAARMRPKLTLPEGITLRDEALLEAIATERRSFAKYG